MIVLHKEYIGKNPDRIMKKVVFLDRDGTLNFDNGHTHKISDFKLIDGVNEALKNLQDNGYKLIIVTNQAGIGRGLFSEEDYLKFRNYMHGKLKERGILIFAEYFCPHHPERGVGKYLSNCNCRKPKTGMFETAAKEFNLDLNDCWMIGDKLSDIEAGKNAGCKQFMFLLELKKIR